MKHINKILIHLGLAFALVFSYGIASADKPIKDRPVAGNATGNRIVVSLKQDPNTDEGAEAACVAIQMAKLLLKKKNARVTMFPSLGGVDIARVEFLEKGTECFTLTSQGEVKWIDLGKLVAGFVDDGGEILVCPLCWISRYELASSVEKGTLIPGATLGNADSMSDLFFNQAHKVIDF